jgi:hypothetical protein
MKKIIKLSLKGIPIFLSLVIFVVVSVAPAQAQVTKLD